MGRKRKSITQQKSGVVSARVDLDLFRKVEELAASSDRTMTQVTRAALREYIDRQESKAA